jgi:tRNA(adenine34) deaminase
MFTSPFMQEAYNLACIAYDHNEVPVGCVIVFEEKIISAAHNQVEKLKDPSAHAEVIALLNARSILNTKYLDRCDLYVTLEPCPMCAYAISLNRIRRVYFAALDAKSGGILNGPKIFNSSSCHHKPEVINGLMEKECSEILQKFFRNLRNNNNLATY